MAKWFERNNRLLKKVGIGAAAVGGVTIATVAAVPLVLGAVGFGAGGVVAGSMAAAIQAGIGNVAAGSLFAVAQSVGAAGLAASTVVGTVGGGAVLGAAGGVVAHLAEGKNCKICDQPLANDQIHLKCGHAFHFECWQELQDKNCPDCNVNNK